PLTCLILAITLASIGLQYRLNVWNRGMFDALDRRDGGGALHQALVFFPLIAAVVGVAATATYVKMTLQRRWRTWLNAHVLDQWLASGRYYQLNLVPGDHSNPEYRVAEDLRLSVDAPVDFAIGIFSAVTSAIVFIGVLWSIGGELTLPIGGTMLRIPGFLVVAAFVYAVLASGSLVLIAPGFIPASQGEKQGGGDLPLRAPPPPGKWREHCAAGRGAGRARRPRRRLHDGPQPVEGDDAAVHAHHDRVPKQRGHRADHPAPPPRPQVRRRGQGPRGGHAGRLRVHDRAGRLQLAGRKLSPPRRLVGLGLPLGVAPGIAGSPGAGRA